LPIEGKYSQRGLRGDAKQFTGTYPAFVAETILDAGVALRAGIQAATIAIRQITTN
jgi:hypothetical protein